MRFLAATFIIIRIRLYQKADKEQEGNDACSGATEEPERPDKPMKPAKTIKILNWNLGQLNIADIRKHTEQKWRGLA